MSPFMSQEGVYMDYDLNDFFTSEELKQRYAYYCTKEALPDCRLKF